MSLSWSRGWLSLWGRHRTPLLSSLPPAWPRASPGRGARQGGKKLSPQHLLPLPSAPPLQNPLNLSLDGPSAGRGFTAPETPTCWCTGCSRGRSPWLLRSQVRPLHYPQSPGPSWAFSPTLTPRPRLHEYIRTRAGPEVHEGGSSPLAAWLVIRNRHVPVLGRRPFFSRPSPGFGRWGRGGASSISWLSVCGGWCFLPCLSWAFSPSSFPTGAGGTGQQQV